MDHEERFHSIPLDLARAAARNGSACTDRRRRNRKRDCRKPDRRAAADSGSDDGTSDRTNSRATGRCEPQQRRKDWRSEEHTSELQSLMRISYAVFCLQKKKKKTTTTKTTQQQHEQK